ncbi:MAG TPA: sigma-54 dependent transcriptional regulator [Polyangia bacterium]|nr:sigma-54 dependent transcriptional regulator [Polyangia bacterium]
MIRGKEAAMSRPTAGPAASGRQLHVLVVDDEKNIRSVLVACLESAGCRVVEAATLTSARGAIERSAFDLVFLDLRVGDENGLDFLPTVVTRSPSTDVVVITAFATISTAVDAIHRGARDYLPKPFTPAQIRHIVDRVAKQRDLEREVVALRSQLDHAAPELDLTSEAASMRQLFDLLDKAAAHDVPVLLRGENGTGKSVLARRLHYMGTRHDRPFVVVNCPTLSEELLASELFGHAKGAFTGAVRDQAGRVEVAEGGTLFLDEIAEMPPALQAKLLRFVQDHEFERIGENQTRRADVRIVAATNRDLDAEVKAGRFREDLLYRLNTFELMVPPLRERREDIVPMARRFVAFFGKKMRHAPQLLPEAEAALARYDWPGNVRELRNAIERAAIISGGSSIGVEALPDRIAGAKRDRPYVGGDFSFDDVEREHMTRVLERAATLEEGARILGIDTSTLWRKRKKLEES